MSSFRNTQTTTLRVRERFFTGDFKLVRERSEKRTTKEPDSIRRMNHDEPADETRPFSIPGENMRAHRPVPPVGIACQPVGYLALRSGWVVLEGQGLQLKGSLAMSWDIGEHQNPPFPHNFSPGFGKPDIQRFELHSFPCLHLLPISRSTHFWSSG